jgi:hypothetical protein
MSQEPNAIRQRLRTPRSAAIAGIVFSLLFTTSLLIMWVSISSNPLGPATAVANHLKTLSFSVDLMPFAGIAFLWFIAVVRDRLGELEDRFFSTIFLGSGLLFIAMVFSLAAVAGGIIRVLGSEPEIIKQSGAYALGREQIGQFMRVYAMRMAGVFMTTSSTIALRTRLFPRWIVVLGYLMALLLLLGVESIEWTPLVFPVWVFVISVYILTQNLHDRRKPG